MELSEEEKKAIKELKHYINITPYWKIREYTNSEIDNYIKIVLNSFEKQQKEIEELKENELLEITENFVSKDKIREKIKEIESYAFTSEEEKNQQDYAIKRINELLEEN